MIQVRTNISVVHGSLLKRFEALKDPRPLLRPVAMDVLTQMTERIHEKGKAADDSPIGTYSKGYMALRTGAFQNAETFKKGKNAGKRKNAGTYTDRVIRLDKKTGVFTGEDKAGKARPHYNRSSDTKVIVSLTRQLENDWAVLATPKGWGIGFHSELSAKKMKWVEEKKNKTIAKLTKGEKDYAINKLKKLVSEKLQS